MIRPPVFNVKWLIVTIIFSVSVIVATHLPQGMLPIQFQTGGFDKIAHALAYGMTTFLLLLSFGASFSLRSTMFILFAIVIVGAADELTQPFVDRTASLNDWLADIIGMIVALYAFVCLSHLRYRISGNAMAWLLAVMPIVDVVLAQIQGQLKPRVGPLSLAQIYHGAMLLIILVILLRRLKTYPHKYKFVLLACLFFAGTVVLSHACCFLEEGLSLENLVATVQILYWLVFWIAAFVACQNARDCRIVLTGIVLAGVYMSLSVLALCIFHRGGSTGYADVTSSFGGWGTAKGLTGPLATSALTALWLCRKRLRTMGAIAFLLCITGLMMTYQRTGQVAVVIAALWLLFWYVLFGKLSRDSIWVVQPAIFIVLAVIFAFTVVGTEGFEKRWEDIHDSEKAGSGRAGFWGTASNVYAELDLDLQLTGVGFTRVLETIEKERGARIHTHSDWFDNLLMFGALGMTSWIILNFAMVKTICSGALHSTEFAIGMAVFLVFLTESFFTGQMFGPHVMMFYIMVITGLALTSNSSGNLYCQKPILSPQNKIEHWSGIQCNG